MRKTVKTVEFETTNIDDSMSWTNLKDALGRASANYIAAREKTKSEHAKEGDKAEVNFWHGQDGLNRAKNLEKYLEKIEPANHAALFALLFAVINPDKGLFESSSGWLALCIAQQLIVGEYTRTVLLSSKTDEIIKGELSSDVILSQGLLESSKIGALVVTVRAEYFFTSHYDKSKGLEHMLSRVREELVPEEQRKLNLQVGIFKKALVADPMKFDPDTIPGVEMVRK